MININKTFAVALAIVLLAPVFAFAEPTVSDAGNAGTQAVASAPSVTDSGNASVSAPSVTDQGNASVTTSSNTPSVTDQGNAAVVSSGSSNGGSNGGSNGSTGGNNGGANNVGSGSGFTTSGGSSILVNTIKPNNSCAYITDYMKSGKQNSISEVTKLQTFLKTVEGLNVDINGKYDEKTVNAVKAFQTKYINDTMVPWGVNTPSGEVYFTTKNKINEIYCKTKISLTDSQKSEIAKYKVSLLTGQSSDTNSDNASTTVGINNGSSTDQTATVSNASFVSRFWKFVKKIFGR